MIEQAISQWTSQRDAGEVARRCRRSAWRRCRSLIWPTRSPIRNLAHRGHFVPLEHPLMGELFYERNGFRLSDADAGYERTSPLLGEHNEMVLGELLGMSTAEIGRLREEGVLE